MQLYVPDKRLPNSPIRQAPHTKGLHHPVARKLLFIFHPDDGEVEELAWASVVKC